MNLIQPVISQIILYVIYLLAIFVLSGAAFAWKKIQAYIHAHTTAQQYDTLEAIGRMAHSYAETIFKTYNGSQKLQEAMRFASQELMNRGINVSQDAIRSSIEKAVLDYNAKTKTAVQAAAPAANS